MKILHCADIHIGYDRHSKFNAELNMNGRIADYKKAFDQMVQIGLAEDIDLFMFCGDAFMNANPSPTLQSIFAECLYPIAEANIPIVILMGNHDTLLSSDKRSSINVFNYYKGNITVFEEPTYQVISTKSGDIQLIALPWLNKNHIRLQLDATSEVELNQKLREQLIPKFLENLLENTNSRLPLVVMGHFTMYDTIPFGLRLDDNTAHEPQYPTSIFEDPKIDYVALGHIHNHQDKNKGKKPPIVYAGSIERTSFKEEHEDKGFVLLHINEVDGQKEVHYEFKKLAVRSMLTIAVDVRGVVEATPLILSEITKHNVTDKIVRVKLKTDTETGVIEHFTINKALNKASHIDPIVIEKEEDERQSRSQTSEHMSIEEGVVAFIQDNEKWKPLQEEMILLAKEIEENIQKES